MRKITSKVYKPLSRRAFLFQAGGALAFLEGSQILAARGIEPFASWFYVFAWWPYIFLIDTVIFALKGHSLIRTRPRELLAMLPWSVFIWLVFELFNLRLGNWHYINVTAVLWERWAGYFASFATVLPGVFLTAELLEALGLFRHRRVRPIARTRAWYPYFWVLGALFVALPLAWPVYFFPLVWGAFVLLLEPFNHRFGAPSLMAGLERGDPRPIYLLLASGAICGLLWEFWNFWARTKWVYTVPFFTDSKLFEMPLAGFVGFPPFALECFVMYNFIRLCLGDFAGGPEAAARHGGPVRGLLAAALLVATCLIAFSAMDRVTVLSFFG